MLFATLFGVRTLDVERLLTIALVAGLLACEQRFSSSPPPLAPGGHAPTSPAAIDALLAPATRDAGPAAHDSFHAMTITLCSASPEPCPPSEERASAEASYRVGFGSARATIRSRGQAMADLYKELRARTEAGDRLDAETRAPGHSGAPAAAGPGPTTAPSGDSSDPLTQCAFHLLDLVDGVGEVTLDIVHESGLADCTVSLGNSPGGHGGSQCLIKAPGRPHPPASGGLNF